MRLLTGRHQGYHIICWYRDRAAPIRRSRCRSSHVYHSTPQEAPPGPLQTRPDRNRQSHKHHKSDRARITSIPCCHLANSIRSSFNQKTPEMNPVRLATSRLSAPWMTKTWQRAAATIKKMKITIRINKLVRSWQQWVCTHKWFDCFLVF